MRREYFIDIWCPLCGKKVKLSGLGAHRKGRHPDIPLAALKEKVRAGIADGSLRCAEHARPGANITGGTDVLNEQKKTSTLGIRSVVSGGKAS